MTSEVQRWAFLTAHTNCNLTFWLSNAGERKYQCDGLTCSTNRMFRNSINTYRPFSNMRITSNNRWCKIQWRHIPLTRNEFHTHTHTHTQNILHSALSLSVIHYLTNIKIFEKNIVNKTTVSIFSKICLKYFSSQGEIERNIIENAYWTSCKLPFIYVLCYWKFKFL